MTPPDLTSRGRAAVASIDALASSAGAAMLRAGGSAGDAAVAASAVLAVTSQHLCGMGGDLLAVVHPGGSGSRPRALVAAGRAGSGASAGELRDEGLTSVPLRGDLRAVTVPGCVDGWLALHAEHGRLPLAQVLAPAIAAAEDGFPLSALLARALPRVADVPGAEELVGATPAVAGELRRRPGLARSLAAIASDGRNGWYGGEFGAGLLRLGEGLFAPEDLARDQAAWVEPLRLDTAEGTLHVPPAPSQAYLVAASLGILDRLGTLPDDPDDPLWAHLVVEASRAAAHDRVQRLYDEADLTPLLADGELKGRAAAVSSDAAAGHATRTQGGGTIYLVAVDDDGMCVSLSQSNASGFGAHIVVPEVGVFLHDRGLGFSLVPGHPAELAPGRRPPHTLAPTLLTGPDGSARAVVGTMGGDAQPQVVLQLLLRLRAGQTPGEAVAAPRLALAGPTGTGFDTWLTGPDGTPSEQVVLVEDGAPAAWRSGLSSRGHRVVPTDWGSGFGHAQLATRTPEGVVAAAFDPRCGSGGVAVV